MRTPLLPLATLISIASCKPTLRGSDIPPDPLPPPVASLATPNAPDARCTDDAKVALTRELVAEYQLSREQLLVLQVYPSVDLTISRKRTKTDNSTSSHKLVTRNGVVYEEVFVQCLTPGRIMDAEPYLTDDDEPMVDRLLMVSFEAGAPPFTFRPQKSSKPQNNWILNSFTEGTNTLVTPYDKDKWAVDGKPILLIDQTTLNGFEVDKKVQKGFPFPDAR